jgi:hypothetical protein
LREKTEAVCIYLHSCVIKPLRVELSDISTTDQKTAMLTT